MPRCRIVSFAMQAPRSRFEARLVITRFVVLAAVVSFIGARKYRRGDAPISDKGAGDAQYRFALSSMLRASLFDRA